MSIVKPQPRKATMEDAHNQGKKAKEQGKHTLNDNPYRMMDDRWDAFLAGYAGEPIPQPQYDHHQD